MLNRLYQNPLEPHYSKRITPEHPKLCSHSSQLNPQSAYIRRPNPRWLPQQCLPHVQNLFSYRLPSSKQHSCDWPDALHLTGLPCSCLPRPQRWRPPDFGRWKSLSTHRTWIGLKCSDQENIISNELKSLIHISF